MIGRYYGKTIYTNNLEIYEDHFKERNVKFIKQYGTPYFVYPDNIELKKLKIDYHVWTTGDRYFKLANKYYGDPRDWWIIAKFNNKPTESHVSLGDVLQIPLNIQEVFTYMRG